MTHPFAERRRTYGAAVDRAMNWMVSHQEPDGGYGPVVSLSHYMALGAALLYCGRAAAAARLMPHLKKRFVAPDGDFDMPEIRARKPGSLLERRYAPAWVVFSAHVNLAFDISLPAMPHLLRYQDPQTGGMFGTIEDCKRGKGIIHAGVTGIAGQAALTTGYVVEAKRMGRHILDNLMAKNPDLNAAFYPIWDTERGLRIDQDAPAAPNLPSVIKRQEPGQHHFLTGILIAFLTDLYRVTRERKYLDGAIQLYEFADGGTPAIYETTASHKFAWGCAWLYRETGQPEHLESACKMCDYLLTTQDDDGSFVHRAFVKSGDEWPYSPRLNITGQFALWIVRTLQMLD